MVDLDLCVVAVENLKEISLHKECLPLGPSYFFVFYFLIFLNLWQHRTDCDPLMHL